MTNTQLELIAYKIRKHAISGVHSAKSGHPGGFEDRILTNIKRFM